MPEVIAKFDGEYAFLSNFHPAPVTYRGVLFPSVENAYQAAKNFDNEDYVKILTTCKPNVAKRMGRNTKLSPMWEHEREPVMGDLVDQKFTIHENLGTLLIGTGNAVLIEGNHWNDCFWGECPLGNGQNKLGKMLMSTRHKISLNRFLDSLNKAILGACEKRGVSDDAAIRFLNARHTERHAS